MTDRFREMSFYFHPDIGETASVSDENEFEAADDLETDHLTKPPDESAASCSNRSCPSTPKCRERSAVHRTDDSRDCLPGNSREAENADSVKPQSSSTSQGTDRLLATSDSDNIVLSDVAGGRRAPLWNSGGASADVPTTIDVDADSVRRKDRLTNGHIPYNFVTTARC